MHIFKPNRSVNVGDVTHYTYKAKVLEVQVFIETRLKAVEFIALRNYWRDKFTRYLVDIFYLENETDFFNVVENGVFLNQQVLDEDLADIY